MSANTHTTETTEERKPPTIADIVREKTGDGALIIDFFTDVMTGRIEGAELCHRIDAAKQLVKYGSKDAAEFIAKYKGVPCGHSINGRPDPADPCSAADRSLVAVTLNAPPTLTRDFLTVLSGIDEFLMARLIRAQTADGVTVIEFLDDVMQDRNDGFKTHHRIAAAKELIVHIVRDEQPSHTPSPSTGEGWGEGDSSVVPAQTERNPDNTIVVPAKSLPRTRYGAGTQGRGVARPSEVGAHAELNSSVVPAEAGTQGGGGARSTPANPAHPEPSSPVVPANTIVVRKAAEAGTQGGGGRNTPANPAHPEPSSPVVPANTIVVPAKAGTQGGGGGRSTPANPARTEPNSPVIPAKSLPRTRYGAGIQGRGGGRNTPANPARTEPVEGPRPEFTEGPADTSSVVPAKEPAQGPQDHKVRRPRTRRTRTQRRRDGAARAATLGKRSERIEEEKDEKPAPVELTPAERRIRERLEQHWHEPDPYGAPIDSTHPGRSPPW